MHTNTHTGDNEVSDRGFMQKIAVLLFALILVLIGNPTLAQEEAEDEDSDADEEASEVPMEEIVVTGSRLTQNPGEFAGQVILLDEEAIRATGEVTLERVLRQIPQNLNPTTERFGQSLNNVSNFTGASTVNLRGLGSESTLILVDGKRIGYNGILGGVTDVSQIPLSMVERIEIVLDGASAIYGPDAVGGVVNVITRKDYEGIEVNLNYDWPSRAGYNETRAGINATQEFQGFSLHGAYQRSTHTGLDAADRDVTLFQQSIFPGPKYDIRFCCSAEGMAFPIAYGLDGDVLTLAEYNQLSDSDKARTTAYTHAILPDGWSENSTVDDITEWVIPTWGPDTQQGYSVLPETTRDSFLVGVSRDVTPSISVSGQLRAEMRNVLSERGYITLSGETLSGRNPNNPFGRPVHVRGQRRDYQQPYIDTNAQTLDFTFDVKGDITEDWDFEASIGVTNSDSDTERYFDMNRTDLRAGMNSDGVTPITRFLRGETPESCAALGGTPFFGLCRVQEPPPPAANPWGDLSAFIAAEPLNASSLNSQVRLEALIRGEVLEAPGGMIRVLFGASRHATGLESETEFPVGPIEASPVSNVAQFNTEAERANTAIFMEGSVPLVGDVNAMPWVEQFILSISLRNDSYDTPDVTFVDSEEGDVSPEGLPDAGAETTWGLGLVWSPNSDLRIKLNKQTAFVAPQLNQLLIAPSEGPNAPFRGLYLEQPDGSIRYTDVLVKEGGNPDLLSETADTASAGFEYSPRFLPSIQINATYSKVDYMNRINRLSNFIIDPNNLPSNVMYFEGDDLYVQERRWINVSSVRRSGMDYEVLWGTSTDRGDFNLNLKHSLINSYDYVIDPDDPDNSERISVVGTTTGSTVVGVVPKKSTNGTFTWAYRGIEMSVDFAQRSKTTTISTNVTNEYSHPTQFDLSLSYHMVSGGIFNVPEAMRNGRVTFVVNNATEAFGKTQITNANGENLVQQSPDRSPLYGRLYHLSLRFPL